MAAFILFVAAALALVWTTRLHELLSRQAVRTYIDVLGGWGYAAYVLIYAMLVLFNFPSSVLTISGALIFGTWRNVGLTVAGATLGGCGAFITARWLARGYVAGRLGNRAEVIDRRIKRDGALAVMILRLLPVVPFNAVSYASGLTLIKLRDFAWATALGMAPGVFAYSYITNQAIKADLNHPETLLQPGLIGSYILVLVLLVGVPVAWRLVERAHRHDED
jgi:uncharacterized membrane protein YdjX (TVP38/TMEM64 family)